MGTIPALLKRLRSKKECIQLGFSLISPFFSGDLEAAPQVPFRLSRPFALAGKRFRQPCAPPHALAFRSKGAWLQPHRRASCAGSTSGSILRRGWETRPIVAGPQQRTARPGCGRSGPPSACQAQVTAHQLCQHSINPCSVSHACFPIFPAAPALSCPPHLAPLHLSVCRPRLKPKPSFANPCTWGPRARTQRSKC